MWIFWTTLAVVSLILIGNAVLLLHKSFGKLWGEDEDNG